MYRSILLAVLIALTLNYWVWRLTSTLNWASWASTLASLVFFLLESLLILRQLINYGLALGEPFRPQFQQPTAINDQSWSVDIFIPTLDEPIFILQRAIAGCQGIHYKAKRIWILDDGDRPEIANLAAKTGCLYLARPTRQGFKAGNLNHALEHSQAEFIAVFDADYVPSPHFLDQTLPFFQNPEVGLVQTPQASYNVDPIGFNLGLSPELPNDESLFYEFIQPIRSAWNGGICVGTSYVVRRSALRKVGGFDTSTVIEDYPTGLLIASAGYRVLYLKQVLSQGLAPESFPAFFRQRLRWAYGTLQVFLHPHICPLVLPRFTLVQRICFLEGLLHWLAALPRLFFLASPPLFTLLNIQPFLASDQAVAIHFLPYYLLTLFSFRYINHRSASALLSDFYSVLLSVSVTFTLVYGLLSPTQGQFKATPKGLSRQEITYHWRFAWPFLLLLIGSLWVFWLQTAPVRSGILTYTWVWSLYNIIVLTALLAILWDGPRPLPMLAFAGKRPTKLYLREQSVTSADLTFLSDLVAQVRVERYGLFQPGMAGQLAIRPACLLPVQITDVYPSQTKEKKYQMTLSLDCGTSRASTTLIQAIYCRPLPQHPCLQEWQVLLLFCSMPLRIVLKLLSLQTVSRKHLRAIVLTNSTNRSLQRVFVTEQYSQSIK